VVSFLLDFLPISYMHSSSPPFVLHALPISSFFTYFNIINTPKMNINFVSVKRHWH
jgi:hypothetical protein